MDNFDSQENLDNFDLQEKIRILINEENDAINHYKSVAISCNNPTARKVLLDIANEEVAHTGELERLLLMLDNKNGKNFVEGFTEADDIIGDIFDNWEAGDVNDVE